VGGGGGAVFKIQSWCCVWTGGKVCAREGRRNRVV